MGYTLTSPQRGQSRPILPPEFHDSCWSKKYYRAIFSGVRVVPTPLYSGETVWSASARPCPTLAEGRMCVNVVPSPRYSGEKVAERQDKGADAHGRPHAGTFEHVNVRKKFTLLPVRRQLRDALCTQPMIRCGADNVSTSDSGSRVRAIPSMERPRCAG